jgi:hypothetical protein
MEFYQIIPLLRHKELLLDSRLILQVQLDREAIRKRINLRHSEVGVSAFSARAAKLITTCEYDSKAASANLLADTKCDFTESDILAFHPSYLGGFVDGFLGRHVFSKCSPTRTRKNNVVTVKSCSSVH